MAFIFSCLQAVALLMLARQLMGYQQSTKRIIAFSLIWSICAQAIPLLIQPYWLNQLLKLAVYSACAAYCFQKSLPEGSLVALISIYFVITTDGLQMPLWLLLLNISPTEIINSKSNFIAANTIQLATFMLIHKLLNTYKQNQLLHIVEGLKNKHLWHFYLGMALELVLLNSLLGEFFQNNGKMALWAAGLAALTLFTGYLFLQALEAQIQNLQYKVQLLYKPESQLRGFWHDFSNHLTALQALLRGGKWEQARQYMDKLSKTSADLGSLYRIPNSTLAALLAEKKAGSRQIIFEYEIREDPEIALDPVDMTIIIGNLIDNAIEAVTTLPEPIPICITTEIAGQFFYLTVSHKRPLIPIEVLARIQQGKIYSSKRGHMGEGMRQVRRSVEKYGGFLGVSSNEEEGTVMNVAIPVNKKWKA